MDDASEHGLQELQRQFPFFDCDLLNDMLREHEHNYDVTLERITNLLDEKMPLNSLPPSFSSLPSRSSPTTDTLVRLSDESGDALQRARWTQFHPTEVLDLHDLPSDEALRLLLSIEQTFSEEAGHRTSQLIEIITGPAKNSIGEGAGGKTRSVILTYLQQRNYR